MRILPLPAAINARQLPMSTEPLMEEGRTTTPPVPAWTTPQRVGFRFAFCYWLLYCLPGSGVSLIEALPEGSQLARPYLWLWHKFTPWTAAHLFHLSGPRIRYVPTGSGDTTLDFVQNFLLVILSLVAAIVWSLLDRRRKEYATLYAWLRVLVRLTLSVTLLSYGIAKIIPTQFRPPGLTQLTETYGNSSPMGLVWTFMGASMPYTIFSGLAEATAALLLLFRRTALLGALAAAAVLLNVAMLNYCYDVPVKLFSTNLLLMALFLLVPDASRLANVFFLNRTAAPAELMRPHFSRRWMRISATGLKLALFAYFTGASAWQGWGYLQQSRADGGGPPVYGAYAVESLVRNGQIMPASVDNPNGWRQVIADSSYWAIRQTDGTTIYFQARFDAKAKTVDLSSRRTGAHLMLGYAQPDPQHLVLTQKVGSDLVQTQLQRIDSKPFLLTTRGYHWINEQPFNR